ncbi:MAG: hypothetical protein AB1757_05795 [Acidobacteriota bacterium]
MIEGQAIAQNPRARFAALVSENLSDGWLCSVAYANRRGSSSDKFLCGKKFRYTVSDAELV